MARPNNKSTGRPSTRAERTPTTIRAAPTTTSGPKKVTKKRPSTPQKGNSRTARARGGSSITIRANVTSAKSG